MAKKKTKKKIVKAEPETPGLDLPSPKAPHPPSPELKPPEKCDTCDRTNGTISKCSQCGKSYCTRCREPFTGRYSNCQFCGASDY